MFVNCVTCFERGLADGKTILRICWHVLVSVFLASVLRVLPLKELSQFLPPLSHYSLTSTFSGMACVCVFKVSPAATYLGK